MIRSLHLAPLILTASLSAQEFELGMAAPSSIHQNCTFEVEFTLTSKVPDGQKGAQGWALGVAHRGLTLLSATTQGTIVEQLFGGGFSITEITTSSSQHPDNDGFISAIILSEGNRDARLPPGGTVTIARAVYYADAATCFSGAELAITDGLQGGGGEPIQNGVTWEGRTYLPTLARKLYPDCAPNDYLLHLGLPADPLGLPLGEGRRFSAEVRLAQPLATASGWTLAVAHDPGRLQVLDLSTPPELAPLLDPGGFALFEITSGPGNSGFTARGELAADPPRALPAPEAVLAVVRYAILPVLDPGLVGTRLESAIGFPGSLRGSGGPISNQLSPPGNLSTETGTLAIEVLPPARFIRGDPNGDGQVDISDPLTVLFYLFAGLKDLCLEAGNANGDGHLDLTDAIFMLGHLFLGAQPMPAPYPDCGVDPTLPSLGCDLSACP